jgi:hypothetical protein
LANIVARQNGNVIFDQVWVVSVARLSSRGKYQFEFPPLQPGEISWSALIIDDDPDSDTAAATTMVRQH